MLCSIFFFIYPATTEIYTLSLHDALPIWVDREAMDVQARQRGWPQLPPRPSAVVAPREDVMSDRKSTRLNSSHTVISYAVFCLKKKKKKKTRIARDVK